jgi:hypothetical protein
MGGAYTGNRVAKLSGLSRTVSLSEAVAAAKGPHARVTIVVDAGCIVFRASLSAAGATSGDWYHAVVSRIIVGSLVPMAATGAHIVVRRPRSQNFSRLRLLRLALLLLRPACA